MRRTLAAVPHSARAGAALLSGGERGTTAMTGRVSALSTMSSRASAVSLLTGTVRRDAGSRIAGGWTVSRGSTDGGMVTRVTG